MLVVSAKMVQRICMVLKIVLLIFFFRKSKSILYTFGYCRYGEECIIFERQYGNNIRNFECYLKIFRKTCNINSKIINIYPGLKVLFPTRWTFKAKSVKSILLNYSYGVTILQLVLRHSNNLFKTLQKPFLTSCHWKQITDLTLQTINSVQSERGFVKNKLLKINNSALSPTQTKTTC